MKKIKIQGFVIETPDGDKFHSTFDNEATRCIANFTYKFNIFTRLMADTYSYEFITWNDLYEDGYRVVPVTLTGVIDK